MERDSTTSDTERASTLATQLLPLQVCITVAIRWQLEQERCDGSRHESTDSATVQTLRTDYGDHPQILFFLPVTACWRGYCLPHPHTQQEDPFVWLQHHHGSRYYGTRFRRTLAGDGLRAVYVYIRYCNAPCRRRSWSNIQRTPTPTRTPAGAAEH